MKTNKNKKFNTMTRAQKRVAIARDVLKQIKLKTKIRSGRYWDLPRNQSVYGRSDLRKPIVCRCCAAGAAILSGIRLFNQVNVCQQNGCDSDAVEVANKWFSRRQLALIERAFERLACPLSDDITVNGERAEKFNRGVKSNTERAVRIFKNIIANNGTFKP